MTIDKELRELFRIESFEHLQRMSDGLMILEKDSCNSSILEDILREAHSLKGAARMVGVETVESLAHEFEDTVGSNQNKDLSLSSDAINSLYSLLDKIRLRVKEAVNIEPLKDKKMELKEISPSVIASPSEFKLDTIRVGTHKLDTLMTQSGELIVTKTHISHRLSEINDITSLWEDWINKTGSRNDYTEMINSLLTQLNNALYNDSNRLDYIASNLDACIREVRLIPLSTIFELYPRMVRDMARDQSKEIEFFMEGQDIVADKRIIEEIKDPLMHLLRNAIDHGIEPSEERQQLNKTPQGTIKLIAYQTATTINIEVSDDGKGISIDTVKDTALKKNICNRENLEQMTPEQIYALIFYPGYSTSKSISDISGRGVGLNVVKKKVEQLKGTVCVATQPGSGCCFTIRLPITLSTLRVMIVSSDGRTYAIPIEYVEKNCILSPENIFTISDHSTTTFQDRPLSIAHLSDLLGLPIFKQDIPTQQNNKIFPCIIINVNGERYGLLVDTLDDEQEIVLKPQGQILKHVNNVLGATILANGEVCMVLDPVDMLKSIHHHTSTVSTKENIDAINLKKSILLVEDSLTTRTHEKQILESAGYSVEMAIDGIDALTKFNSSNYDAVVTDIIMPNMDGLTLTEEIRRKNKDIPIILVTSLNSDEDKIRGIDAGANAYIAKPTFDQQILIDLLRKLV